MERYMYFGSVFVTLLIACIQGQRVAPGVPPQQYVHQQVPVQHQQPPQYQQVPVQQQQQFQQAPPQFQQQPQAQYQTQQQQQQPPQAQYQQQVPVQHQQPQGHGHGAPHGHNGQQQQILNAANIQQERAHIAEHMEVPIDTSKMSEQELQFHYFKMHDSDNNNKLDGCELIKSLIHWHEQGSKEPHHEGKPHVEEKVFTDEELIALIDPILQMDDTSHDGFIDYPEFIKAQQKAAAQQKQQGN